MWKIRGIAAALVCTLLLSGCGAKEQKQEVLLYEGTAEEERHYETVPVKKGTYQEEVSATGSLYYTKENVMSVEDDNAYLDEICVKNKQHVKKGDIIAYYHIASSKSYLRKQKLLLEQAKGQYEAKLKSKQNEILEKEKELHTIHEETEKKIAVNELKKLQKEYEGLVKSGKDVRQQEKEYRTLVRKQKKTPLRSRYTGTAVEPASVAEYEGAVVSGEPLLTIRDESEFLIRVEEGEGFRYNMTVEIGMGATSENIRHTISGTVISTDNLSEAAGEEGAAQLVKIKKKDREKYNFNQYNLYVKGVTLRIENALMADADAVYEETEKDITKRYVLLVENGKLHKRYIVSNYRQDTCYLVNQGVEEGQELAILKS